MDSENPLYDDTGNLINRRHAEDHDWTWRERRAKEKKKRFYTDIAKSVISGVLIVILASALGSIGWAFNEYISMGGIPK